MAVVASSLNISDMQMVINHSQELAQNQSDVGKNYVYANENQIPMATSQS